MPPSPCCSGVHTIVWSSLPLSLFSLHALLPFNIRKGKANAIEVNSPSLIRAVSLSHLGCWPGTSSTLGQLIKVIIHSTGQDSPALQRYESSCFRQWVSPWVAARGLLASPQAASGRPGLIYQALLLAHLGF